jgi:tRNA(Ile2) C34 agmatinyltransferase TiaS
MPQIQPYPPICPQCRKPMKLMLVKEASGHQFQCSDCGQPAPMQNVETQRWLNSELGSKE